MLSKEDIENLIKLDKLKRGELSDAIDADMPVVLKKVSGGLTIKEMKEFRKNKIFGLKEKENKKGERVPLSNDDVFFDVVVPLLEMRGVDAETLENVEGGDYLSFYKRVEALTNNPKLKKEVEKKS